MALVKCVECQHKISTLADKCPHCGAPLHHSDASDDSEGSSGDTSGCLLKAFLVVIVLGLIYLLGKKHIDPVLLKFKDTVITSSDRKQSPTEDGGKSPNILHRKSDEAKKAEALKTPVDPDMGEKITRNLLHPKENREPPETAPEGTPEDGPAKPAGENTGETAKEPEKTEPETPAPVEEPVKAPDEKPVETTEPDPTNGASGDPTPKPSDPLLAAAGELKLKIVDKLARAKEGLLIVTVNDNWPMLSKEQKKEAAASVYNLWVEKGGSDIEFLNSNGDKVATLNRSSKLIHGKISFVIHDTK